MFSLQELKRMRKQLGMTQAVLAKKAGVSQSLIAKIESGRIDPAFTKARKLYDVLTSVHVAQEPKAAAVMSTRIISAQHSDSVRECARTMEKFKISQLPVFHGTALAGLLSESAIVELIAAEKDLSELRAGDAMEEAPPLVPQSTPLRIVAELLTHAPLVVVTSQGAPQGVITKADLLKTVYQR